MFYMVLYSSPVWERSDKWTSSRQHDCCEILTGVYNLCSALQSANKWLFSTQAFYSVKIKPLNIVPSNPPSLHRQMTCQEREQPSVNYWPDLNQCLKTSEALKTELRGWVMLCLPSIPSWASDMPTAFFLFLHSVSFFSTPVSYHRRPFCSTKVSFPLPWLYLLTGMNRDAFKCWCLTCLVSLELLGEISYWK